MRKTESSHTYTSYNCQEGNVLLKPTLAAEKQFRTVFQGALSYFIAGVEKHPTWFTFAI
jgi:hypothetical protein